jgi:hypothetical protein
MCLSTFYTHILQSFPYFNNGFPIGHKRYPDATFLELHLFNIGSTIVNPALLDRQVFIRLHFILPHKYSVSYLRK